MRLRHLWLMSWLCLAGAALALEDAIPMAPTVEPCDHMIVPTYVWTLGLGIDLDAYAEKRLDRDQDISLTRSVYRWEEPIPFAIFVDLLQDERGGLVRIDVADHYGNPTWSTVHPVPPMMAGVGLVRQVIPVEIPRFQLETAFPRTSVYTIRASAYPLEGASSQCAFSASTSVVIDPSYPSMYP